MLPSHMQATCLNVQHELPCKAVTAMSHTASVNTANSFTCATYRTVYDTVTLFTIALHEDTGSTTTQWHWVLT
jgi:hypothetical protein